MKFTNLIAMLIVTVMSVGQVHAQTCRPGEAVQYSKPNFHFDVTFLLHTTNVEQILTSNYKDIGRAELPLYKSGEPRYAGPGQVAFRFNANADRLPATLPFLHNTICAGMARVEQDGPGRSKVMTPIQGGSRPGQVSLVVPRNFYQSMRVPLVPCVEAVGVRTVFDPVITEGHYKGWPNMRCNKGSGEAGVSHAMQRMRDGKPGELYVFVVDQ